MVEIIKKILSNQNISINELSEFLIEYIKLFSGKEPNSNELQTMVQMIQIGMFDLNYMIKNACIKLNLQLYEITNQHGQLIKRYINE